MAKQNTALKFSLMVVGIIALIVLTIWGAIWVSNIDNRKAAAKFPPCTGTHTVHKANIENDKVIPEHIDAKRCDKLIITNLDDQPRIIAFGVHEKHVAYDGVTERYVSKDGKVEVTLVQLGKNFLFHDHNDEEVEGTFSVSQ
jgi:hypothetical protein